MKQLVFTTSEKGKLRLN